MGTSPRLDGDPDQAEKAIRTHLSEVLRIADDLAIRHPDLIETGH